MEKEKEYGVEHIKRKRYPSQLIQNRISQLNFHGEEDKGQCKHEISHHKYAQPCPRSRTQSVYLVKKLPEEKKSEAEQQQAGPVPFFAEGQNSVLIQRPGHANNQQMGGHIPPLAKAELNAQTRIQQAENGHAHQHCLFAGFEHQQQDTKSEVKQKQRYHVPENAHDDVSVDDQEQKISQRKLLSV